MTMLGIETMRSA